MKTAIITGANRGIGLDTAIAFARTGYTVYATMRDPEKKSHALSEAKNAEDLPITIIELDVNSDASVNACFEQILSGESQIDVLVNNAGIERRGSVEECDIKVFEDVMNTNYLGPIRCIQQVMPRMRSQRHGCIINVTSVAGKIASSPLAPYTASKHAFEALSECLAQEVKPYNIRVAIVEPGIINTDMARDISVASGESIYPHMNRMAAMFTASLDTPTSPTLVADKILEVANSDSWELRHPVGPDAAPFLEWRAGMSDEEWIVRNSVSDHEWAQSVKDDFGMDVQL